MPLDPDTRDLLLERIGLSAAPAADAAGLRELHRAFVSAVPFENLAIQLGEAGSLDLGALTARMLQGGRGGYCFEVNAVLMALIQSVGLEAEGRQAIVGPRFLHSRGAPTDHLAVVVHTPDEGPFLADTGWGEGPLDPLPLAEGVQRSGAFGYELARDGDGWWLAQHEFGVSPGYRFEDRPADTGDFDEPHERMSTPADARFVRTLVLQRPHADRIVALRARTLSVDGPGVRERTVLGDQDAFAGALAEHFGVDPAVLGPDRLARLWDRATGQHRAAQI